MYGFVVFQFKIRKEALVGLGQIYRRCCENDVPDDINCASWIRNKVLHAYYHSAIDDKYLSFLTSIASFIYYWREYYIYFIVGRY